MIHKLIFTSESFINNLPLNNWIKCKGITEFYLNLRSEITKYRISFSLIGDKCCLFTTSS